MSITKYQNKHITIGDPVGIDLAVNEIRILLSSLTWVSHPYFIAKRFVDDEKGKKYIYPETYCKDVSTDPKNKYPYHKLTPDNDYTGMFFAFVAVGSQDTQYLNENFLTYNVGFIFSVNLELIDKDKLDNGLFTRSLMAEARRLLNQNIYSYDFKYSVKKETDDLKEVYREFTLNDLERYNRAPLQCFRFDLEITIQEDCF